MQPKWAVASRHWGQAVVWNHAAAADHAVKRVTCGGCGPPQDFSR